MIALLASLAISQFGPEIFSEPIPPAQPIILPPIDHPKGKVDLFIKFAEEDFLTQIDPSRKPQERFLRIIEKMGSPTYKDREDASREASSLPLEASWVVFYYGLKDGDPEIEHRCKFILETQHICPSCGGTGICGFCGGDGCKECYQYREMNKWTPLTPALAKKRYRDSLCGSCFGTGDFIPPKSEPDEANSVFEE